MKLILTRHGQSLTNANNKMRDANEHRHQGQYDSDLSPLGYEQARRLGLRFAGTTPHAIYSSDLKRAFFTAEEIGKATGTEVVKDVRLRERGHGIHDGGLKSEFRYDDLPEPLLVRKAPQGENYLEHFERVGDFLAHVFKRHSQGEEIVIVSHGGTMRQMFSHLLGIPLEEMFLGEDDFLMRTPNTCVFIFERDENGKWEMMLEACTKHLDE